MQTRQSLQIDPGPPNISYLLISPLSLRNGFVKIVSHGNLPRQTFIHLRLKVDEQYLIVSVTVYMYLGSCVCAACAQGSVCVCVCVRGEVVTCASLSVRMRMSFWIFCFSSSSCRIWRWRSSRFAHKSSIPERCVCVEGFWSLISGRLVQLMNHLGVSQSTAPRPCPHSSWLYVANPQPMSTSLTLYQFVVVALKGCSLLWHLSKNPGWTDRQTA